MLAECVGCGTECVAYRTAAMCCTTTTRAIQESRSAGLGQLRYLVVPKREWEGLLWPPKASPLKGCSHSQWLAWKLLQEPLLKAQFTLRNLRNCWIFGGSCLLLQPSRSTTQGWPCRDHHPRPWHITIGHDIHTQPSESSNPASYISSQPRELWGHEHGPCPGGYVP